MRPHLPAPLLVVGAAEDEDEARRIFAAARRAGVPVNVIDRPAFCSFRFGAVVNRSPLVVGISTDGAAPVFGQAIRWRIEAPAARGFAAGAGFARRWRAGANRRLELGRPNGAVSGMRFTRPGPDAPRARAQTSARPPRAREGTRWQGAHKPPGLRHTSMAGRRGPGNPELLTLAAVRALRSADIILYDDLVAPEVLDFARREAKRMLVGQTGHPATSCRQGRHPTR